MNRVLQPDVHPDAESLNAFVERALPQPERAQIVAHLGGCARCREVAFLAQAAAEADTGHPHTAIVDSQLRTRWFRAALEKWRNVLIPAAALSAAAAILIAVHVKSAYPAATVAQVAPPSPMPPSAAPPVPRPAEPAAASAAPSAAMQHVQPKAARAEQRISQSPDKKTLPVPPIAPLKGPGGSGSGGNLLSTARQADAQRMAIKPVAPVVPSPGNADWNSESGAKQAARGERDDENAQITPSPAIAAQPPPAPVPPNLVAVHGNVMAPAAGAPRPLAADAATSRQMELKPQPVNGLAALALTSHPRLPSGTNAISLAVMFDRILAVDREGAVFLSRDAAKHWERVPIQWTGKAVAVQAPPRELYPMSPAAQRDGALHTTPVASVSINPEPPAPRPAVPPPAVQSMKEAESATVATGPPPSPASTDVAPPMPGMLFKLINDHHQMWVSADGKVWHEQQGRE